MHTDQRIMSFDDVREYIEEHPGYPNVSFGVFMTQWEGPAVRIVYSVDDNFNPGEKIVLGINSYLPPFFNADQIDAWLQWRMWRIEGHEARERFRVGDKTPFHPHEEGANALP